MILNPPVQFGKRSKLSSNLPDSSELLSVPVTDNLPLAELDLAGLEFEIQQNKYCFTRGSHKEYTTGKGSVRKQNNVTIRVFCS